LVDLPLGVVCLDRNLSDHRPILMREMCSDYGAIPFRFFHLWFQMDDFDKMVEETWKNMVIVDNNDLIRLKKLQFLKQKLQTWTNNVKTERNLEKVKIQNKLIEIDRLLDHGGTNSEVLNQRMELMKSLDEFNSFEAMKVAQKAKLRWSIKGDENTKYFHGVLNNKRSQLAIRGVLVDGEWVAEPVKVKRTFFSHFANWFDKHDTFRLHLDSQFPKVLSMDQVEDLERQVTIEEIKRAVCDCGENKSPGPDGFTDIQSAFIANRQILDGRPFILNELISWCKFKNYKAMIFKVDFEKAYDSVRWDYLDDILRKFRFGDRWCMWIKGCLNSSMGSVIVNGSPTSEFQFFKGLKQGDPLSHFLFILVMESLHISFSSVLRACLSTRISIGDSLKISHLFFTDDAVFVGEWKESNLITIINVLKCFFLASGLKINMQKSKLIGIDVGIGEVDRAANIVGCSTLTSPFSYLRVTLGGSMGGVEGEQYHELGSQLASLVLAQTRDRYASYEMGQEEVESLAHLLFSCSMARVVLSKVSQWWGVSFLDFHSYEEWLHWFSDLRMSLQVKNVLEGVFLCDVVDDLEISEPIDFWLDQT
ncbi:RNA-directed DNA polymerase, eukaryota, partial [Tanacetum coccineum]